MCEGQRGQWIEPAPAYPSPELVEAVGGNRLLAEILVRRGLASPEAARAFLDPEHYTPAPASDLPDLSHAVDLIEAALARNDPILVWGDFDVDGQAATALLLDALRGLGASAAFHIPDRVTDSHGIRPDRLRAQIAAHRPRLLITCDTGTAEHEAVALAREHGITTIITDHHDLPDRLPPADAIVNPRRLPPGHPLAALPGTGVAYKLVDELYARCGQHDALPRLLDLVALGIVADVAAQAGDTRFLLQLGLGQLRAAPRTGLRALIEVAGLAVESLDSTALAFDLAPRLNAAGRLASAALGVELLTTGDESRARLLAAQLDGLNRQRRAIQREIAAEVEARLTADPGLLDAPALLLTGHGWHPGVLGAVAGQLAEKYRRPVVLVGLDADGAAYGSARSVPGIDISSAIAAQADLLARYGGHPGAAGFSLHADHVAAFRERLLAALAEAAPASDAPALALDAVLTLGDLTPELAAQFQRLAPFSEGNPPVTVLVPDLTLKSAAYLDRQGQHRRLTVQDRAGVRDTLFWWRGGTHPLPETRFDAAVQVEVRTWQGAAEVQIALIDTRPAADAQPVEVVPPLDVIDCRDARDPARALADLRAKYPDAAIWAEGYRRAESPGVPLSELAPALVLIVYTAPAGPRQMRAALARVRPQQVILLGADPPLAPGPEVQRRLLELCRYVIARQDGATSLDALAEATAGTPGLIRALLDWLAARGELQVTYRADEVIIMPGDGAATEDAPARWAEVSAAAAEIAAYRAFFRQAAPHAVIEQDV